MEEAKMELMRTAKCPDNQVYIFIQEKSCNEPNIYLFCPFQGTPLLILANKQDLPMAKEPKELEKLLGLHELSPIALSVSSGTLSSIEGSVLPDKTLASSSSSSLATSKNSDQNQLKSYHIQPTCAITGEGNFINFNRFHIFNSNMFLGLHEGLDHLYDMIIRKRKMQKQKKKR